jgi:hypothetical protein
VLRPRVYFTDDVSLEAVFLPVFRSARFDRLSERSSPFNIIPAPLRGDRPERPSTAGSHAQGGARLNATLGRVDWSVSAFRGFQPFELYEMTPLGLSASFERFTMVGGDFETVAGPWGMRGEVAYFPRDSFQFESAFAPGILRGSSLDAGVGIDRRAGEYRVSGTVLFHRERYDASARTERDVSVLFSADRTFARERYQARAFAVYNPSEDSGFGRVIFTAKLHDDVAAEASGGWFAGDGRDTIGRFSDSDFLYVRLKYYF